MNVEPSTRLSTGMWTDFWYAVTSSKLLIAAAVVATVTSTYLALQLSSDVYETEARILVKLGRENVDVPATVENGGVIATGVRKEEINSYVLLLSSRALLEEALDEIGLEAFRVEQVPPRTTLERIKHQLRSVTRWAREQVNDLLVALNLRRELGERDRTLLALEGNLEVERERDSDVISVRLELGNPELAVRIVDVLIRLYRDHHIAVRRDTESSDFFAGQTAEYQERLASYERTKANLRRDYALSSIQEERNLLLNRLHELYRQNEEDERELTLLASERTPRESAASDASGEGGSPANPSIGLMKDRITQLRMRRVETNNLYQPESAVLSNLDEEIASLELVLADVLDRRIDERSSQAAQIESRLARINEGEDKLGSIERERALATQSYTTYTKRWEEARISEELDRRRVANISILSEPTIPIRPVRPRRLLMMALSVPIGLVIGFGLALLLHFVRDRVQSARDIDDIDGIVCLGSFNLKRGRVS